MSQMAVSNIAGQNPGQPSLRTIATQTTTTFGPFSCVSEIEERRYRQQLVFLLHAYKCQKRDSSNGEVRGECNLDQCQGMRNILSHIQVCQAGNVCTVQNCASSRALILHWKNCTQDECALCLPIKQAHRRRQQLPPAIQTSQPSQAPNPAVVQRAYATLGLPFSASNNGVIESAMQNLSLSSSLENEQTSQNPSQIVNPGQMSPLVSSVTCTNVKDWYKTQAVSADLRQHLIQRIVQEILLVMNKKEINDPNDPAFNSVIEYARRNEAIIYESANTREEYYYLVAEKIYNIRRKELTDNCCRP